MDQENNHPAPGGGSADAPGEKENAAVLSVQEVRVLAVLAEKEALTPDNYPLSLNALTNGCNQLSSREPVMSLAEEEVQEVLDSLMAKKLVSEVRQAGSRVTKYEHRMRIRWALEQDKLAVLVLLMLRGAQTAGEIRNRAGRVHEFGNVAEVEGCLQFLIDKYPPLTARLPRAPGTKEARYAHLLSGDMLAEDASEEVTRGGQPASGGRIGQLEREVASLREELETLKKQFEQFREQFD